MDGKCAVVSCHSDARSVGLAVGEKPRGEVRARERWRTAPCPPVAAGTHAKYSRVWGKWRKHVVPAAGMEDKSRGAFETSGLGGAWFHGPKLHDCRKVGDPRPPLSETPPAT